MLCTHCQKRFKKASVLRDHLNKHENIRAYACNKCPKSYFTRKHLNVHRKKHEKPLYECCGYKFYVKDKYVRHKKSCGLEFVCPCGKKYKRKKCYEMHMAKHLTEAESIMTKTIDQQIIKSQKKAYTPHLELGPGQIFISANNQKIPADYEVISNNNILYLKCQKCNKLLKSKNIFRVHYKNQHLMIKDYICKCGKMYGYKKDLVKHLKNCKSQINDS